MASNNYQWPSDRVMPRKVARVHEIDAISAIHAQLVLLTKKLDATNVRANQTQNPPYAVFAVGQPSNEGQAGNFGFPSTEQANYVNNFQRNNNPYSNTCTPAWRNHPNLGWGSNNNNIAPRENNFQQQKARPSPPQEKKPSLEETMQQLAVTTQTFMITTDTNLKNQAATIHNLEV